MADGRVPGGAPADRAGTPGASSEATHAASSADPHRSTDATARPATDDVAAHDGPETAGGGTPAIDDVATPETHEADGRPVPAAGPGAAHEARAGRGGAGRPAIDIVGLHGGQWFGRDAEVALRSADALIGHARQLAALGEVDPPLAGEPVELWGDLDAVLSDAAARRDAGRRACILAAGDPGFFGLVRLAAARLGPGALRVFPAPSSVALAWARVGSNWDDARVVSAHGRPLEHAVDTVRRHPKVAVLVSRDQPPEALGRALLDTGCGPRRVAVCSRLGEPDETVTETDLDGLAAGTWDPLSVVVLRTPDEAGHPDRGMGLRWGLPDDDFAHRGGMVTKAEVRAVVLGKLALPAAGVLWDVGAGSGSVAIEAARLRPGLEVFAVERREDDLARIRSNARAHGVGTDLHLVAGTAPDVLSELPDPDRVFVGGGGLAVLDAVLGRVRAGGVVVATYAVLASAVAAAERLGDLVQVQVSRGVAVGDGGGKGFRLAAENPVLVCWGEL